LRAESLSGKNPRLIEQWDFAAAGSGEILKRNGVHPGR
jgi:hypothetical protein